MQQLLTKLAPFAHLLLRWHRAQLKSAWLATSNKSLVRTQRHVAVQCTALEASLADMCACACCVCCAGVKEYEALHAMKMMRGLRDVHMREVQMVASAAVAEVFATVFVKDAGERSCRPTTQDKRPLLTPRELQCSLPTARVKAAATRDVMNSTRKVCAVTAPTSLCWPSTPSHLVQPFCSPPGQSAADPSAQA